MSDAMSPKPPTHPLAPTSGGGGDSGGAWDELQAHLRHVQEAVQQQLSRLATEVADVESAAMQRAKAALLQQVQADRTALEIEQQQLHALQEQLQAQQQDLLDQLKQIDQRRAEVHASESQLAQRAAAVDAEAAAVQHTRAELSAQRQDIDKQAAEVRQLRDEVQAKRDQFAQQTRRAIDLLRQQQKRQIEKLNEARRQSDEQVRQAREQALKEHENVRKEIETDRAALENLREGLSLRQEELQRRQAEVKKRSAEVDARRAGFDQQLAEIERARAAVDARQARHTQRIERLRRMKQAIKKHADDLERERGSVETSRRCARQVLEQRDSVMEMQRLLLEAEHRMIFRWGLEKSLGWIGRGLVAVLLMMVVSYFAGEQLAKPIWAAGAIVQQDNPAGGDRDAWIAQQRQRLLSDETVRDVLTHLHQQGATVAAQPQTVRQALEEHLKLVSPAAGTLVLELRGERRDELTPMLTGVVRALAGSRSLTTGIQAGTLPGAGAGAGAGSSVLRVVQEPKLLTHPVEDGHLMMAAIVFGVGAPLVLIAVAMMAMILCRTARRESAGVQLEIDHPQWQNMAAQLQSVGAGADSGVTDPAPADEATHT